MPPRPKIQAVPSPEVRPSGLMPIPDVGWGDHISAFYGTIDDLFEIVGDFFSAGLAGNEACLWVASDSMSVDKARDRWRGLIPDVDGQIARNALEIVEGDKWYLTDGDLDLRRVTSSWIGKAETALSRGFEGLRIVGNAFWLQNRLWASFCEYENQLSKAINGAKMIVLCVYPLNDARASDVLDITKAHDFSIVLRNGRWEFMESPEHTMARREIDRLQNALDILSLPFPGYEKLTPRERLTLAQVVRGASNKEAARFLQISPRTVEFHRANIMRKLGTRNLAELMAVVLGGPSA